MITITSGANGRLYSNGKISVPSVTTIFGRPECPRTMTPAEWEVTLAGAATFGTAYGKGCADIERDGTPDVEATESDGLKLALLIESYWRWFLENVKEVLAVEIPLINAKLGFGGTFDVIAILNDSDTPAIIDHKATWEVNPQYGEQLTAYSMLNPEFKDYRLIILRARKEDLKKDAVRPPQMKEYKDAKRRKEMREMFISRLETYKLNERLYGGKDG